jgi:hypothetical protein
MAQRSHTGDTTVLVARKVREARVRGGRRRKTFATLLVAIIAGVVVGYGATAFDQHSFRVRFGRDRIIPKAAAAMPPQTQAPATAMLPSVPVSALPAAPAAPNPHHRATHRP